VYRAQAVPGVASAREFVFHTIQREHRGKLLRMSILGLSWPEDKGDWLPLVAGRPLRQNHYEMIVDKSLGLELGDQLRLGKNPYRVVGLTSGMVSTGGDGMAFTSLLDSQAIQFDSPAEAIRLERAARDSRGQQSEVFLQQPQLTERLALPASELPPIATPSLSAVLVTVRPGNDIATVQSLIESWQDVSVYTTAGQEDLLVQGIVDKARKQLFMFRVLLTIIAAIIMALILYTLTLDKIYAIALLKLIGAPNRTILGMILQQALLLGGLGYLVAYAVGTQLFPKFPRRVVVTTEDLVQLAIVVGVISVASSLLGIWKALKVEPNTVLMN
jgi:putative ABC transport system permease protein